MTYQLNPTKFHSHKLVERSTDCYLKPEEYDHSLALIKVQNHG